MVFYEMKMDDIKMSLKVGAL